MSFEPRLFDDVSPPEAGFGHRPDEPVWDDAEQLELPDDLAMFAAQLRDDAMYLARKHPPQHDGLPRPSKCDARPSVDGLTRPTYIVRRVAAAAAILLAVSIGSWSAWHWSRTGGETPAGVATTQSLTRPARIATPVDRAPAVIELPDELPQSHEPPRVIPASFLREVTGPELDGMLDLLREDESGLSI